MAGSLAYSIADAVKVSGLGRSALYEEIREGRLVARKARGRTLILRADLEAWLAALPKGTAPQKEWLRRDGAVV